jgi:hypothetical protein
MSKNIKIRIYKTIILPLALYGREIWCLTLREEHRLRVFENKVLRRIFGQKRVEVTGEWRKLHTEELHNLYSSPNIIRTIKSRRMRWAGYLARIGKKRNPYRISVRKRGRKRPLRRPKRKWVNNTKIDLRAIEWDGMDWIDLAQDTYQWRTFVKTVMKLRLP